MGLRIGYIGRCCRNVAEALDSLQAAGCSVVKVEDRSAAVLPSLLSLIGAHDELVVPALSHLISESLTSILDQLEPRGATLYCVDEDLSTCRDGGLSLRAALEAVRAITHIAARPARRRFDAQQIFRMHEEGVSPTETRTLGISRMSLWRKLRAAELAGGSKSK